VGGKADSHVGDQRWTAGGALLDEVDDLASVHHGEVRGVPGAVDEPGERHPGDSLQRRLAGVAGGELVGRDAQAVAALVGEVHDEAALGQGGQQLVRRRTGEPQLPRDRRRRHRTRLPPEVAQDRQHLVGRGDLRRAGHGTRLQLSGIPDRNRHSSVVRRRGEGVGCSDA
jgi:hypothetical protein